MRPFIYTRANSPSFAVQTFPSGSAGPDVESPGQYLAGGTNLIDLMKIDVLRPQHVIDINALASSPLGIISTNAQELRLGALVHMADAADHPEINRAVPVIAQSLRLAASQQLRNMASLGGNVLQRTRCPYYRDVSYSQCNKRRPGSGCAALDGFNRMHAVLGTSDQCIATYPGDFAQALIALDAQVELQGANGTRAISVGALHRRPGDRPDLETTLAPGEMITAFVIKPAPWMRRSLYLKIRDRGSYEFALASAAVAMDLEDGRVREARIALGGVATVPWRAQAAEALLRDQLFSEANAQAAADAAFAGARTREHNAFKVELGKRTLKRALTEVAAMEA
ncbi:MAG: xanthine dehydrogenase family protein subunit M [Xanthobacteraceae bacterium]|nr:xanthine dehydrogenase family protein subunit M [Xanthobacteraceae bacterium]MBV9630635.1 xanthine dehydrogenase family protein subunit M [Xanthobacteraceae bacterium]